MKTWDRNYDNNSQRIKTMFCFISGNGKGHAVESQISDPVFLHKLPGRFHVPLQQ